MLIVFFVYFRISPLTVYFSKAASVNISYRKMTFGSFLESVYVSVCAVVTTGTVMHWDKALQDKLPRAESPC